MKLEPAGAGPEKPRARPAVSAIIPLYNKRSTILRAIDSVRAQTFPPNEIVVVDDGGEDGSIDLVEALRDPAIRILRQRNQGPGPARNAGAALARAPLLAFLDADDEWRPNYLEEATRALARHPDCAAYACGYDAGEFRLHRPNNIRKLGKPGGPERVPDTLDGPALKTHLDSLHCSSTVLRRELFERYGGFYAREKCLYGEDSWFWVKVLFSGRPIYWEPRELVRHHVEDSAIGYADFRKTTARPISLHSSELFEVCPPAYRESLRRLVDEFVENDLRILIGSGMFAQARALRRSHGRDQALAPLRDRLRWGGRKIVRAVRRVGRVLRASG